MHSICGSRKPLLVRDRGSRSTCFALLAVSFFLRSNSRPLYQYGGVLPSWEPVASINHDGVGILGSVQTLLCPQDADIMIAGGGFDVAAGISASNVARLPLPASAAGARTLSKQSPDGGVDGTVYASIELGKGQVMLGGDFTSAGRGEVPVSGLIIYDSLQDKLMAPPGSSANAGMGVVGGDVRALVYQPSLNLVVIGGSFSGTSDGIAASRVAAFDFGQSRVNAMAGGISNGDVFALVLPPPRWAAPPEDVIAGGSFGYLPDSAALVDGIARFDGASRIWRPIGINLKGCDRPVVAMAWLDEQTLILGGQFNQCNDQPARNVARLVVSPPGDWAAAVLEPLPFASGPCCSSPTANYRFTAVFALQPVPFMGGMLIGGHFGAVTSNGVNEADAYLLAFLNASDSTVGPVPHASAVSLNNAARGRCGGDACAVYAMAVDCSSPTTVWLGGKFDRVGAGAAGVQVSSIVSFNFSASPPTVGTVGQPSGSPSARVHALARTAGDDESLWVAGAFRWAGTGASSRNNAGVALWDGRAKRFSPVVAVDSSRWEGEANAVLEIQRRQELWVGGTMTFTLASSPGGGLPQQCRGIVRVQLPSGSVDIVQSLDSSSVLGGVDGYVNALVEFNGSIIGGGNFDPSVQGELGALFAVKLSTASDIASPAVSAITEASTGVTGVGPGRNGVVTSLAVVKVTGQPEREVLIVGGSFSRLLAEGTIAINLVAWTGTRFRPLWPSAVGSSSAVGTDGQVNAIVVSPGVDWYEPGSHAESNADSGYPFSPAAAVGRLTRVYISGSFSRAYQGGQNGGDVVADAVFWWEPATNQVAALRRPVQGLYPVTALVALGPGLIALGGTATRSAPSSVQIYDADSGSIWPVMGHIATGIPADSFGTFPQGGGGRISSLAVTASGILYAGGDTARLNVSAVGPYLVSIAVGLASGADLQHDWRPLGRLALGNSSVSNSSADTETAAAAAGIGGVGILGEGATIALTVPVASGMSNATNVTFLGGQFNTLASLAVSSAAAVTADGTPLRLTDAIDSYYDPDDEAGITAACVLGGAKGLVLFAGEGQPRMWSAVHRTVHPIPAENAGEWLKFTGRVSAMLCPTATADSGSGIEPIVTFAGVFNTDGRGTPLHRVALYNLATGQTRDAGGVLGPTGCDFSAIVAVPASIAGPAGADAAGWVRFIAGTFYSSGMAGIARFDDSSQEKWIPLSRPPQQYLSGCRLGGGRIFSMVLHEGALIIGGSFQECDGQPAFGVARYTFNPSDPSGGQFLQLGSGLLDASLRTVVSIQALLPLPDGRLLLAGVINNVTGRGEQGLVTWDGSTGRFAPLLPAGVPNLATRFHSTPLVTAVSLAGDTLTIVGRWQHVGQPELEPASAQQQNGLARLNLATWQWSRVGSQPRGVNGLVKTLAPAPLRNNALLVGGDFVWAGDSYAPGAAVYHPGNQSFQPLVRSRTGGAAASFLSPYELTILAGSMNPAALLEAPDGSVFVAGKMSTQLPNGTSCGGAFRVLPNGTALAVFTEAGTCGLQNGAVAAVAMLKRCAGRRAAAAGGGIYRDSYEILFGGEFFDSPTGSRDVANATMRNAARLEYPAQPPDSAAGASSSLSESSRFLPLGGPSDQLNGRVSAIVPLPFGDAASCSRGAVLAGSFTFLGPFKCMFLAVWDGATLSALLRGEDAPDDRVTAMTLGADGVSLFIAGAFTKVVGVPCNGLGILRLNTLTFVPLSERDGQQPLWGGPMTMLTLHSDVLVAGAIDIAGIAPDVVDTPLLLRATVPLTDPRSGLIRGVTSASDGSRPSPGSGGSIRALAVLPSVRSPGNFDIYAAGTFSRFVRPKGSGNSTVAAIWNIAAIDARANTGSGGLANSARLARESLPQPTPAPLLSLPAGTPGYPMRYPREWRPVPLAGPAVRVSSTAATAANASDQSESNRPYLGDVMGARIVLPPYPGAQLAPLTLIGGDFVPGLVGLPDGSDPAFVVDERGPRRLASRGPFPFTLSGAVNAACAMSSDLIVLAGSFVVVAAQDDPPASRRSFFHVAGYIPSADALVQLIYDGVSIQSSAFSLLCNPSMSQVLVGGDFGGSDAASIEGGRAVSVNIRNTVGTRVADGFTSGAVFAFARDDSLGRLYAGGTMTGAVSGGAFRGIAYTLDVDGTGMDSWKPLTTARNSGCGNTEDPSVRAEFAVYSLAMFDGALYIGGWIGFCDGLPVSNIARFRMDAYLAVGTFERVGGGGVLAETPLTQEPGIVYQLLPLPSLSNRSGSGPVLLVAGAFRGAWNGNGTATAAPQADSAVQLVHSPLIAVWNRSAFTPLPSARGLAGLHEDEMPFCGWSRKRACAVRTIAVDAAGNIWAAGDFEYAGSVFPRASRPAPMRLGGAAVYDPAAREWMHLANATLGLPPPSATGLSGPVGALLELTAPAYKGAVVVAGSFTFAGPADLPTPAGLVMYHPHNDSFAPLLSPDAGVVMGSVNALLELPGRNMFLMAGAITAAMPALPGTPLQLSVPALLNISTRVCGGVIGVNLTSRSIEAVHLGDDSHPEICGFNTGIDADAVLALTAWRGWYVCRCITVVRVTSCTEPLVCGSQAECTARLHSFPRSLLPSTLSSKMFLAGSLLRVHLMPARASVTALASSHASAG